MLIESLSSFIDDLSGTQRLQDDLRPLLWFRGHANRSWALRPAVLRDDFLGRVRDLSNDSLSIERLINNQFRREGSSMLPADAEPVEIYFFAQHYGLPTRLLDWTANPLAALFFAAAQEPDADGEVVAIQPVWSMTAKPSEKLPQPPLDQRHALVVDAVNFLFDLGDKHADGLIVPIQPDLRSARMLQQGACFTLHLPGSRPIKEESCRRASLPAKHKETIVKELRAMGVNWATLFPDLDHLAQEIREHWKLRREI